MFWNFMLADALETIAADKHQGQRVQAHRNEHSKEVVGFHTLPIQGKTDELTS